MPTVTLSFEISPEHLAFAEKLRRGNNGPLDDVFRMALELGLLDLADEANRAHREEIGTLIVANRTYGQVIKSQSITKASKNGVAAAGGVTHAPGNGRARFSALHSNGHESRGAHE